MQCAIRDEPVRAEFEACHAYCRYIHAFIRKEPLLASLDAETVRAIARVAGEVGAEAMIYGERVAGEHDHTCPWDPEWNRDDDDDVDTDSAARDQEDGP